MKLNLDCVRDILFTVEENTNSISSMTYHPGDEFERLEPYSIDEIRYHIMQCEEFGLIRKVNRMLDGTFVIRDLSPEGHMFLADIRSDANWEKTKTIAQKVGSNSMSAIIKIASELISSYIKSQF